MVYQVQETALAPTEWEFWLYIILSLVCVVTGGIMSGLTIGLFSIDPLKLAILKNDTKGNQSDRKRAEMLQPLLVRHHHVLVTLLVMNATAMEALPIFLDALVPAYGAVIISVVFVLLFGEILPQALFNKNALKIGAAFAPLVRCLMYLTAPVSWPIAKLLDKLLGEEGGTHFLFERDQLTALVEVHEDKHGGILKPDQVQLLLGALHFGDKLVKDVMTPLATTYMVALDRHLDFDCLEEIFKSGFSRVPVYDKVDGIVGLLITKDLILVNPEDNLPISTLLRLYGCRFNKVFPDTPLHEMLRLFKTSRTHLAIVHDVVDDGKADPKDVNVGIITLEDIIQEIFEDEDEPADDLFIKEKKMRFNMLMLDSRRRLPSILAPQETFAVFHHLVAQIPLFAKAQRLLGDRGLSKLLSTARVVQVTIEEKNRNDPTLRNTMVEDGGMLLYTENRASDCFTLVLDGLVEVKSGIERFVSIHGRWSFFFVRVLEGILERVEKNKLSELPPSPGIVPDFTAHLTRSSRLLRITTKHFVDACKWYSPDPSLSPTSSPGFVTVLIPNHTDHVEPLPDVNKSDTDSSAEKAEKAAAFSIESTSVPLLGSQDSPR